MLETGLLTVGAGHLEEGIEESLKFTGFFKKATGFSPFPYQSKIALASELPSCINAPTGAGKTAAALISWIWRRHAAGEGTRNRTPRRLVYCLPMRTLVEQTTREAQGFVSNLGLADEIGIQVLMGGEDQGEWFRNPEKETIIIGTQDMLLSRALNRGYGMSEFRWPVDFAWLNNDCVWVMDEIQLMGPALETSCQLDGFRRRYKSIGGHHTIWMSATMNPEWIDTVDNRYDAAAMLVISLSTDDINHGDLKKRWEAKKDLYQTDYSYSSTTKKDYARAIAGTAIKEHKAGTLTLVILNQVEKAQSVYREITKTRKEGVSLIHSRFRQAERVPLIDRLIRDGIEQDRIVVSTQVVEAGVDISARTLITELCPWSSFVQRAGRCNRRGEFGDSEPASIHWIDIEAIEESEAPYTALEMQDARMKLGGLVEASPRSLSALKITRFQPPRHVIRSRDMMDLFDTTTDLGGNHLDISRYIRDDKEREIQAFWREIDGEIPSPDLPMPSHDEICRVTVGAMTRFLKGHHIWIWDWMSSGWVEARGTNLRPGSMTLISAKDGGYSTEEGWTGADSKPVLPVTSSVDGKVLDSQVVEPGTHAFSDVTLIQHLEDARHEASVLTADLHEQLGDAESAAVVNAAWWHDIGKAHEAFQTAISDDGPGYGEAMAKSSTAPRRLKYRVTAGEKVIPRPYFRHELASALVLLGSKEDIKDKALVVHLVMAHHGKVRGAIRSLPDENEPYDVGTLFARGVWQDDPLPAVPSCWNSPSKLDLSPMKMGPNNWTRELDDLLERYGPFRLAYLEALVRIADWRASAKVGSDAQ